MGVPWPIRFACPSSFRLIVRLALPSFLLFSIILYMILDDLNRILIAKDILNFSLGDVNCSVIVWVCNDIQFPK